MGSAPAQPKPVPIIVNQYTEPIPQGPLMIIQPKTQPNQVQQRASAQKKQLEWPLPPPQQWERFHVTTNTDPDRYTLHIRPPSSPTPSAPDKKASKNVSHNQTDTSDKDWEKKIDSSISESAHVQSQLTARSHACFNLATSDNIDVLMANLKESHKDLDDRIKRRLALISIEADKKLTLIIEDTKREQDRLLTYDKTIQTGQEELYQEWLQLYIIELNKWRSKELATLQQYLMENQKQVVEVSRRKINRLNEDTNRLKTIIVQEEQARITQKTSELTDKIFDISKETGLQHLGSESKTELNLRIQANVGRMVPGQGCTNDPTN